MEGRESGEIRAPSQPVERNEEREQTNGRLGEAHISLSLCLPGHTLTCDICEKGQRMHNYIKTKQVLGSGTYGEVTKAYTKNEDGSAGRAVAVKKLFLQRQAVEGLDITALRDIKFLRELHHPNVIEVRNVRLH